MCQSCVTSSAFFALEEIQTLNMSWSLGCCKLVKMMSVLTSLKDNTLGPAIFASSWPISKAQTDEGPFFFPCCSLVYTGLNQKGAHKQIRPTPYVYKVEEVWALYQQLQ